MSKNAISLEFFDTTNRKVIHFVLFIMPILLAAGMFIYLVPDYPNLNFGKWFHLKRMIAFLQYFFAAIYTGIFITRSIQLWKGKFNSKSEALKLAAGFVFLGIIIPAVMLQPICDGECDYLIPS